MLPKLTLVLGGAASGKSVFAESLVQDAGLRQIYVATSQVYDEEMAQKVMQHRDQRGDNWTTIEEPIAVADALNVATKDAVVLIDCATLWLTNLILGDHDVAQQTGALLDAIDACPAPIVIVSNEVGQGIVPDNALSRQFRNAQGKLNQDIAAKADLVVAVMAGLPMVLKGQLP
jgi:adenosylcobinamide kinase/adenosylcobinamide-phosphate guanylyltransferase